MIEQAMIFTLGFLVAGLAALMIAPAFWRRAVRLARRRIEAQVPVSLQEILAERDQLRAQNAVECRRIEDRAAALTRRHAADMSELGRRAARIAALEAELAARDDAYRTEAAQTARLARELAAAHAAEASAQKALYDADADARQRWDAVVELRQAVSAASALAEVRAASVSASENYAKDLTRRVTSLNGELATAQARLRDKTREWGGFQDMLGVARSDLAKAQKKLETEGARTADLEAGANALRAERQAAAAELRGVYRKLENSDADLRDLRARERVLLARQAEQAAKLRDSEAIATKQIHQLQANNASLQGALDVARRRCEELEGQLTSLRTAKPSAAERDENAVLRQSITDMGAAMIRLAGIGDESAAEPPTAEPANGAGRGNGSREAAQTVRAPTPGEIGKPVKSRDEEEAPVVIRG